MPAAAHVEKDGHLHEHPAAAAVARQGARPAGRRALRAVVHAPPRQARAGALRRLRRASATGRSSTSRGTTPEHGAARASPTPRTCCKEINGYDVATGEPGRRLRRAQGRRHDRVRLLDLLRRLRRRRQPGAPARPRRHRRAEGGWVSPEWAWAWPANRRMLYNRASADPRGQAVVGAQEVRLVGRGRRASGPATTSPTSRSTSAPDYRAADGREGHGRDRRRRPVHHDGRRPRLAVRARRACSTARCRRTTSRSSRRCRTCSTPSVERQPGGAALGRGPTTRTPRPATRATRSWRRPSG